MATEATFTIPASSFPLGSVFEEFPGVRVELERVVPAEGAVVPYVWVRGAEIDDVESAVAGHRALEDIGLVDVVEDEYLLRVEWKRDYEGVLSALTETDVPLVEAVGTEREWTFEIRGDDREDVAAFQQRCRELDVSPELTALHALTPVESEVEAALTDAQAEALVLALERGYFESPRDATLADLGEVLDISDQAVASRIRRGTSNVLESTLSAL